MMRSELLIVLALLAAGCLEGGRDEGPGAGEPSPTSPTTPPGAVSFREVDSSPQSGYREAGRLVITEPAAWATFWERHSPGTAAPNVDFASETILVAALGPKGNGCWAVRVTSVEQTAQGTQAVVTTHTPPEDMACISVVSYPITIAAVSGGGRAVVFEEREATYPPADMEE